MSGFKLSEKSNPLAVPEAFAVDQPLGLTVHSMPRPEQLDAKGTKQTVLGRYKMILVMLVCASPVIASYFTFYVIRPEGRRNYGELISPQIPLPEQTVTQLDGQGVNLGSLKGQWLLLSVGSAACLQACVQQLYLQRQLRESLGREKDRIDRVWLVSDDLQVPDVLLPGLKEATVLRMPADAIRKWLSPAPGQSLNQHLYLIDPMGNWMMRFPANLDLPGAGKAKRDLDRLLRASASWDEAGRVAKP